MRNQTKQQIKINNDQKYLYALSPRNKNSSQSYHYDEDVLSLGMISSVKKQQGNNQNVSVENIGDEIIEEDIKDQNQRQKIKRISVSNGYDNNGNNLRRNIKKMGKQHSIEQQRIDGQSQNWVGNTKNSQVRDHNQRSPKDNKDFCINFQQVFKKLTKTFAVDKNKNSSPTKKNSNNNYQKNLKNNRLNKGMNNMTSQPNYHGQDYQKKEKSQIIQLAIHSQISIQQQQFQGQLQEGKKQSPAVTNQSQIGKIHQGKHYPKMIVYSQIQYVTIGDKINYHLDTLQHLAIFIQNVESEYHHQENPWCELIFLLYKKYNIQYTKIQKFLKKYPMVSPFKLKKGQVSTSQMLQYTKLSTGKYLLSKIQEQNYKNYSKLKIYLQTIINVHQKSSFNSNNSAHLNTSLNIDNFNANILKGLWEYIAVGEANKNALVKSSNLSKNNGKYVNNRTFCDVTFEDLYLSPKQKQKQNIICQKIARAMQVGFIIGELTGKKHTVDIQVSQGYISGGMAKGYISQYRENYKSMIQQHKS